ncbi:MAG: DEAD/DEAH box helicase [Planctomycetes bacterium]|nr:DEAD/DEAH box helicase [Planctomycetota bacterium]
MTETRGPQLPIRELKGVGPIRAERLLAQGIATVADLLAFLPRRYRVLPPPMSPEAWLPGEIVTVVGEIRSLRRQRSRRRGPGHLQLDLRVAGRSLRLELFNQGFLRDRYQRGDRILASGRLAETEPPTLVPLHHRPLADAEDPGDEPSVLVDYGLLDGLKPGQVQALVREALAVGLAGLDDALPEGLRRRRGLLPLAEAIRAAHGPADLDQLAVAERRLRYNACLVAGLRVESARGERTAALATAIPRDAGREAGLRAGFPFRFTAAQDRALEEILADLARPRPMRRLLQGDVGSGKTAVAVAAAAAAALAGHQVALMAPTEVLARQLQAQVAERLQAYGLVSALVLGRLPRAEKRALGLGLARGEVAVAVGTQALFAERLDFAALGLVIVDEQHRFGVMQRLKLIRKGRAPHLLAMSATPIPRSLALTVCSDLDLSVLDERPPGRKGVATRIHSREIDGPYDWGAVAAEARAGARCYVVFPAIDSEEESIPSLFRHGRQIARRHFRGIPVAALHGQMDDEEKIRNLEAFRRGDVRVLFATTVIEVGVDVPDARRIIIVGAGRFGLAQLHQLRGRVGRGGERGHCDLLVATRKAAESDRLGLLEETEDGFVVAERDLELRGPGDMMGLRQHGLMPAMRLIDDEGLLIEAFADARELIAAGADVEGLVATLAGFVRRHRGRSREFMEAG